MFAVDKTGGKQYKVAAEDIITIEKISGETGDIIQLNEVLMLGGSGDAQIGAPLIEGASVAAEVLDQLTTGLEAKKRAKKTGTKQAKKADTKKEPAKKAAAKKAPAKKAPAKKAPAKKAAKKADK